MAYGSWVNESVVVWDDFLTYGGKWHWFLQLDYKYRQDVDARKTQVNIMQFVNDKQNPYNEWNNGTLTVGAKYGNSSKTASVKQSSYPKIYTLAIDLTFEVTHDDEGNGSATIQWYANNTSTSPHEPKIQPWSSLKLTFPKMEDSGPKGWIKTANGLEQIAKVWVKTENGLEQVKNVFGEVIQTSIVITSQPQSASGSVGDDVTFSVQATGSGLTYQWEYGFSSDGMDYVPPIRALYEGTDTNTLIVHLTSSLVSTLNDVTYYRCIVTDSNGNSVTSNAATLTVN